MDLQMPNMSGIEAMIGIRSEFPNARILVLTTYAGDVQMLRAFRAGARGYLLKANVHTDLLEAIALDAFSSRRGARQREGSAPCTPGKSEFRSKSRPNSPVMPVRRS
jgi:DNA-binding NarL/FixJ family response regulator